MAYAEPLYRRTEADESWWPEGGYREFRYGPPWRTWLKNGGVLVGGVMALGLSMGLPDRDWSFGFQIALFFLFLIGVVYLPIWWIFQARRELHTYIRVGPVGLEWVDDIFGERRDHEMGGYRYHYSPSLGRRPRRLRWEDVACVAVPRASWGPNYMRLCYCETPGNALITVDGLRDREGFVQALRDYGGLREVSDLPDDQAKSALMLVGWFPPASRTNLWRLLRVLLPMWPREHEADLETEGPEWDELVRRWEISPITRKHWVVCGPQERLTRALLGIPAASLSDEL